MSGGESSTAQIMTFQPDNELPPNQTICIELLRILSEIGRPVRPKGLYGELAKRLKLTAHQLSLKRHTKDESRWNNRVQAAKDHLVKQGFIENARHGFWSLTDAGLKQASSAL